MAGVKTITVTDQVDSAFNEFEPTDILRLVDASKSEAMLLPLLRKKALSKNITASDEVLLRSFRKIGDRLAIAGAKREILKQKKDLAKKHESDSLISRFDKETPRTLGDKAAAVRTWKLISDEEAVKISTDIDANVVMTAPRVEASLEIAEKAAGKILGSWKLSPEEGLSFANWQGAEYNFEALILKFMFLYLKDQQLAKKAFRELRNLAADVALLGHETAIAFKEMTIAFETMEALAGTLDSYQIQEKFKEGQVQKTLGTGQQAVQSMQKMSGIIEGIGEKGDLLTPPLIPGQILLTDAQRQSLDNLDVDKEILADYDKARTNFMEVSGGTLGALALRKQTLAGQKRALHAMQQKLSTLEKGSSEAAAQKSKIQALQDYVLDPDMSERELDNKIFVQKRMLVNQTNQTNMRAYAVSLRSQLYSLSEAQGVSAFQAEALLHQMAFIDDALAGTERSQEGLDSLKEELKNSSFATKSKEQLEELTAKIEHEALAAGLTKKELEKGLSADANDEKQKAYMAYVVGKDQLGKLEAKVNSFGVNEDGTVGTAQAYFNAMLPPGLDGKMERAQVPEHEFGKGETSQQDELAQLRARADAGEAYHQANDDFALGPMQKLMMGQTKYGNLGPEFLFNVMNDLSKLTRGVADQEIVQAQRQLTELVRRFNSDQRRISVGRMMVAYLNLLNMMRQIRGG